MEPLRIHLQQHLLPVGCVALKVHNSSCLSVQNVQLRINIAGGCDLIIVAESLVTTALHRLDRSRTLTEGQALELLEAATIGLVEYKTPQNLARKWSRSGIR